ncbi:MAG: hypothetical protein OEX07_02360 [Gammaproteobacteria bacterium]|nr:hypothetical protein [Gammaproteobacteria bacterium]
MGKTNTVLILIVFFLFGANSANSSSIQFPYVPKNTSNFPWQLFVLCEGVNDSSRKDLESKLSAIHESFTLKSFRKTCVNVHQYNITHQLSKETISQLRSIKKYISELSEIYSKDIQKFIDGNGEKDFEKYTGITSRKLPSTQAQPDKTQPATMERQFSIVLGRESQSLGSLEERFIAGLADFVIERANEESMLYFQEELNENLCLNDRIFISKKPPEKKGESDKSLVKEYFANLCEVFKSQVYGFSLRSVGSYLRTAAKTDLENFPDVVFRHAYLSYQHYKQYPNDPVYKNKKIQNNVSINGFRMALAAYRETRRGMPALDIMRSVTMLDFCADDKDCQAMVALMRTAAVIIQAVDENIWPLGDEMNIGFQLAGALLTLDEMLYKRARGTIDVSVKCKLNSDFCLNDLQLERLGREMIDLFPRVLEIIRQTQFAKGETFDVNRNFKIDPKHSVIERTIALEESLTLIADITSRFSRYQDANILDFVTEDKVQLDEIASKAIKVRRIFRFGAAYLTHDRVEMAMAGLELLELPAVSNYFDEQAMYTVKAALPFITELASAQSAQEVSTVIQAAAAPVGSYKMKQRRKMTSITAFAGLAIGKEQYINTDSTDKDNSFVRSIFVPVGLHMSFPIFKSQFLSKKLDWANNNKFRSAGLFLSAIDLGTFVAWREATYDSQDSVKLFHILSPGIYGTLHVAGPGVVGVGMSATPKLLENETGRDISVWRAHVFVAIDLTLFPF